MSYLVLPQTQGARFIYQDYVDPYLAHHEREIEELIGRSHERAKALGLQYFYQAIDLIREKLFGFPPQQKQAPPPPTGPAAYAQSLLSRFNIPTAATSSSTPNDWYSALSSALGSVTTTGKSREAREEELSASGTLLQRQLRSMNSTEKAQYISTQREVLDFLRSTLAREEQAMSADPETDDLAYGAPLRKDPSDNSFDVVTDEDLISRTTRRPSGRWTSGWLGNDHDSSGSSGTDYAARSTGYDRY